MFFRLQMQVVSSLVEVFGNRAAACRRALVGAAAILSCQCGGSPASASAGGTSPTRRICDGSSDIRLAYRWASASAMVLDYTRVLSELGFGFLYVDGNCHYWIQEPARPNAADDYLTWRSYREGQLGEGQESRLHDAVSYDDPSTLPECSVTTTSDAPVVQLWDGATVHSCPGRLSTEWDWPMRDELFQMGKAMTGPVRIEVGERLPTDVPEFALIYPWPLTESPSAYVTPESLSGASGQSRLIGDPAEAAALRSLRDQFVADAERAPGYYFGIIYVEPRGFMFAMRDDLPFADPGNGLWSPE
jgi:hypothetical protein